MCIVIYKPKGKTLTRKLFRECWDSNPHGAGFMFANKGHVVIRKGYFSFRMFWRKYQEYVRNGAGAKADVIIHFRLANRGIIDTNNCHPHRIDDKFAFAHNGTIPIKMPKHSTVSDSIIFRDKILNGMPPKWLAEESLVHLVRNFIGASKLVFLDGQGNINFINKEAGEYHRGCWFSNDTYRNPRFRLKQAWIKSDQTYTRYAPAYFNQRDWQIGSDEGCRECTAILRTEGESERGICEDCFDQQRFEDEETMRILNK